MAKRPEQNQNWYLRECISYNPKVREEICNPSFGYLGASNYFLYAVSDKQLKTSIDFTDAGKALINSDDSIEIVAGERSGDKDENILLHARRGNISITADRTGDVRISGNNVVIESNGDLEYVTGGDFIVDAANMRLQGNSIDADALTGSLVPPTKQFLFKVFANSFVGGGTILKVLGLFVG
jgi:hypothetical protein